MQGGAADTAGGRRYPCRELRIFHIRTNGISFFGTTGVAGGFSGAKRLFRHAEGQPHFVRLPKIICGCQAACFTGGFDR